jgi:hypothetical protein
MVLGVDAFRPDSGDVSVREASQDAHVRLIDKAKCTSDLREYALANSREPVPVSCYGLQWRARVTPDFHPLSRDIAQEIVAVGIVATERQHGNVPTCLAR